MACESFAKSADCTVEIRIKCLKSENRIAFVCEPLYGFSQHTTAKMNKTK